MSTRKKVILRLGGDYGGIVTGVNRSTRLLINNANDRGVALPRKELSESKLAYLKRATEFFFTKLDEYGWPSARKSSSLWIFQEPKNTRWHKSRYIQQAQSVGAISRQKWTRAQAGYPGTGRRTSNRAVPTPRRRVFNVPSSFYAQVDAQAMERGVVTAPQETFVETIARVAQQARATQDARIPSPQREGTSVGVGIETPTPPTQPSNVHWDEFAFWGEEERDTLR